MGTKEKVLQFFTALIFFFFGNNPTTLKIVYGLLIFMVFDFVFALIGLPIRGEKFDYKIFSKGIVKKTIILACVSFGYALDYFNIFNNYPSVSFEIGLASAFTFSEILSVAKKIKGYGVDIPILDKYFELDNKELRE